MTAEQAREQAQNIAGNRRLDHMAPEDRQYICDAIARELLVAQAEAYEHAALWTNCVCNRFTCAPQKPCPNCKAAELRRAAEGV